MASADLSAWMCAGLLMSARIAPVLAFAPPFTLTRLPAGFRLLLGVGLATVVTSAHPPSPALMNLSLGGLFAGALKEAFVGVVFVLALQMMFAALQVAGRTLDIQAGLGLASLIDPTSHAQTPLVGTLFAYAAGVVFFALEGHLELLRLLTASVAALPPGGATLGRLAEFLTATYLLAFGVAGGTMLALFLTDAAIALMARTIPQMNVLMLGFQVKTVVLLLALPMSFGASGALFARLARVTFEAIPGLL